MGWPSLQYIIVVDKYCNHSKNNHTTAPSDHAPRDIKCNTGMYVYHSGRGMGYTVYIYISARRGQQEVQSVGGDRDRSSWSVATPLGLPGVAQTTTFI